MESKVVLKKINNYFIFERLDLTYKLDNTTKIISYFLDNNDYICFCASLDDAEDNSFIRDRVIFRNRNWVEPWWQPETLPQLAWYKTDNESEVKQAIRNDQFFSCIILKKHQEFAEYTYVISCIEDDIGDTLCIFPKDEKTFIEDVLPKIRNEIGSLLLDH